MKKSNVYITPKNLENILKLFLRSQEKRKSNKKRKNYKSKKYHLIVLYQNYFYIDFL